MLQLLLLLMCITPETLACKHNRKEMKSDDSMYEDRGFHYVNTENKKYHRGCPKYTDITPMYYGERIAACFWSEKGHVHPLRGCNGKVVCYSDDTTPIKAKKNTKINIGSVVVLAGCKIGYRPLKGDPDHLMGPVVQTGQSTEFWKEVTEIRISCNKSFNCHDNSGPILTDKWDTIGIFDNSMSKDKGEFKYTHKIGMDFKDETSKRNFIDASISGGAGIEFNDDKGGANKSLSLKTGYDWKKTSTMVKTEKQDVEAKIFVPAGQILHLEQIIGECPGAFTAHTEVIRAVTKTANSAQP